MRSYPVGPVHVARVAMVAIAAVAARAEIGEHTLGAYIERAKTHNPGLRAMRARVEAASHDIGATGALADPTAEAGFGLDGSGLSSVGVKQEIMWPWGLARMKRMAREAHGAGQERYRDMENDVLSMVRGEYAMLYKAGAMIRLLRESLRLLSQAEQTALADYAGARRSQMSVVKLQLEAAVLEDRIAQMEVEAGQIRDRLGAYIDLPPESIPFPESLPVLPVPAALEEVVTISIERNPAVRAMERDTAMAAQRLAYARTAWAPGVMVGVQYGLPGGGSTNGSWMGMAGLSLPLAVRAKAAGVASARSLARASAADLRKEKIDLEAEATSLFRQHSEALRRIALLDGVLVPKAEQALTAAEAEYRTGMVSVLDFIDAQRMLIDLRMERLEQEARREMLAAEIVLCCLGTTG